MARSLNDLIVNLLEINKSKKGFLSEKFICICKPLRVSTSQY